jgi:hypothetical protein
MGSFFHDDLLGFSTLSCRSLKVSMINLIKMKKGKFILLAVLFFILSGRIPVAGQNDVCVCASYSSLQYITDHENIFPPGKIKSEKIKQVVIYTTGHSSADSTTPLFQKYIDLKFNFDSDGYVSSRTHFYLGRSNHIYEFERNALKQITKQSMTYLDSLEQKTSFMPPQVVDYVYDKNNRLILVKNRDFKGNIMPDKKATYQKYEYDKNGRLTKSTMQLYFEYVPNSTSIRTTSYKYSKDGLTRITKTIDKSIKKFPSIDTTTYNHSGKTLSIRTYHTSVPTVMYYQKYNYDVNGNLTSVETGPGGGSECPDKGKYTDHYFYSANGLVEKVINRYEIYSCVMNYEYLK